MSDQTPLVHSFNAGEISRAALSRVDIERTRLNCEIQENLLPYTIGKAIMRAGSELLGQAMNGASRLLPFSKTLTAKAVLELAFNSSDDGKLRVWFDDELVTRTAVSSTIANGTFATSASWTTVLTGDASASFSGALQLAAPARGGKARVYQAVATTSLNVEHALRIIVDRGPVRFKIGSALGQDDYLTETSLDPGTHSLVFTPTVSPYYIEFSTKLQRAAVVTSIAVEGAGTMEVDAPWGAAELRTIRFDRSLDVTFLARNGLRQQKIERRGNHSWSVVDYRSDDGPFTLAATADITLTPGATYGNTTLTASDSFFKGTHVGALFRLTHETVVQTCALGAQDEVTATIRVVGIKTATHNDRVFGIDVAGTFVGTLQVQRSFDSETTGFSDYDPASATITAPGSTTFSGDDNDNSITWYRVKMKAYTSGSAVVTLSYEQDSGSGVCRVTGVVSSTVANVEVLSDFRNVAATKSWLEGEWSDRRGYPTAIAFFDGRLWWSRDDRFWGSVSGDYFGYSLDVTGDSGSIQRDISTGGDLAQVYWLLPLQRLIFGTAGEQDSGRSSSFDEPLTPTNLTLKTASTRGASNISPLKVDTRGIFVGRSGKQMYELFFDLDVNDYQAASITRQHEDLALSAAPEEYGDGFVELCLQREPENYIWGIREDGQVATMIYEPKEKVAGWFRVLTGRYGSCATNGDRIISMCMLPSTDEDLIYLNVERNVMINGTRSKLYCIEKLKRHIDATTRYSGSIVQNGLYMMDSFITAEADETTTQTISGLDHLIGNAVMAVGKKLGQTYYSPSTSVYIVDDNGEIELNEAFTGTIAVGRPYEGRYLSSKEAYGGENGTAIGGTKRIAAISLQLLQTHYDALRMGRGVDPILDDRFDDRGVRFGGTAYATRGAGLTGAADSKKATISFWIRRHAGTGGRILAGATSVGGGGSHTRFALGTGTNRFSFVLNNAADSAICDLRSSPIPTGRWVHVIASVDLSDTGKRHIYVDDVSDLSQVTTYTNDTADFTLADWGIGALASGASVISADIADLWFMPGFYLDLSDEANRRLFTDYDYDVDESGRLIPVDLGSDGSAPTGTAPLVYLSGAASAWHQNKGTGGGFTLNGMLSASLSLPVEDPDMDELPRLKEDGTPVDVTQPFDLKIDQTKFPFPGEWDADVRLGLKVRPGYSAILSSIVMDIETNP